MPDIQPPERIQELPVAIIKNMVMLATSGLGLVVALAWNAFIQKIVQDDIDPYLGKNGGLISLLIYAVIMTTLAVLVIMQLTALQHKIEKLHERIINRKMIPPKSNKLKKFKKSK